VLQVVLDVLSSRWGMRASVFSRHKSPISS
jgi:hypothetical protein